MVGSPTQAEPVPSAVRPTRLTARRRLRVRQPHAGGAAEIQRGQVLLGEAGQHGVAGAGPSEGAGRAPKHVFERARVRLLGIEPEVARAGRASAGSTRAKASAAGGPPCASARAAAAMSATPSAPTSPERRAEPNDAAGRAR